MADEPSKAGAKVRISGVRGAPDQAGDTEIVHPEGAAFAVNMSEGGKRLDVRLEDQAKAGITASGTVIRGK